MSSSSTQSDSFEDRWWLRWPALRRFYHPLLRLTDQDYNKWLDQKKTKNPSKHAVQQLMTEAEASIKPFESSAKELIGYNDIVDEITSSVYYWIFEDQDFRKICPAAPPKVFILKGSSGTGKTTLVHSIIVESFMRGKEKRIPVYATKISPHKIYEKWLGESEKKLARTFDQAFSRHSIIFIDEAQSLAQTNTEGKVEDSGMQAYMSVQTTLLEKVNELIAQNHKCILILATNEYGSISEAVRRRSASGVIDLDNEITKNMLRQVVEAQIRKYDLKDLPADEVLKTIENKVRALGHGTLTPADIVNAFQIVIEKKTRELRASYVRRVAEAFTPAKTKFVITLDDFREIRQLKEYSEDRRSSEIRSIVTRIRPKIRLDDVGGLNGIKEQLLKDVELSLDQEQARRVGARPIRGVLLHGPPGCGKTWLAQAIAGELDATIYMIKGGQIIKPYHGQTEKIIIDVFDEARKNAPSIIIIDEVDSLTLKREMGGNLGAVTTLLSEMGGLKPLEGVVVMATTNKLQLVDEAFLRAGRFDRIIEIPPPKNDKERVEIINVHLRNCEPYLDPSVTPDSILGVCGKRTLTPARIERLISDANELRVRELNAAMKLSQTVEKGDIRIQERIRKIYRDDLERLKVQIGLEPSINLVEDQKIAEALKNVVPENYRLTLLHFRTALELSSDQNIEEIRRITASLRGDSPEPTVGKVYGLAALSGLGESAGLASDGTVAVIECVCNPFGKRGRATVIGSEVAPSVRASAEHARVFLNEQCDWALRNYEFYLDFITFAKGLDQKVIQGPSAGAAMTLAEFSAATKKNVLPNVVITGAVTPKGELVQVGGLDFKGMGKFVAALNTDGVDTIIIPFSNYETLNPEDKEFFEKQGLKIKPAKNFWEVANEALESHPDKETAVQLLKTQSEIFQQ